MATREELLARLDDVYDFPCPVCFKIIGPNEEAFVDEALAAVRRVVPDARPASSQRASSKGKHLALTFDVLTPDAESVLAVYAELRTVSGLRMLL